MNILIIFLGLTLRTYAPEDRVLYAPEPTKIQPYERIWDAVCLVESNYNPDAIGDKHLPKHSFGIAQIRQERLDDYNKKTGRKYCVQDLFNPEISKQIFMYYSSHYGVYRIDEAIRAWNGSGPATYDYLTKIKSAYEKTNLSL